MARPRKRKRGSSAKGISTDEPPTKKGKAGLNDDEAPALIQAQHAVLNQFYPRVLTLRNYTISRLPQSSRIRRKKVAAVGVTSKSPNPPSSDEERALGLLLDTTLVGMTDDTREPEKDRLEGWKSFSQKGDESYITLSNGVAGFVESQSLIIEYVIRTLFSREKSGKWPKHLLCEGYRRNGGLGLRAIRPNVHVEALQRPPWPQLLALLGESGDRIMMDLLIDCAVFVSVKAGANNYLQISGKPLSDVETYKPEISQEAHRLEDSVKTPSDIVFVRNRILYARAALNARGMVHFGLRHIHVLNRSPYVHLEQSREYSAEKESQLTSRNELNTLRVMMYIFPRQFGLHNVFTSKVNLKETSQRLKDYTLREEEISDKFGRLGDPDVRVRTPKRLRGSATELSRKLQILHQRCSYSKLLQHYCPVHRLPSQRDAQSPEAGVLRKHPRKLATQHKNSPQSRYPSSQLQGNHTPSVVELATSSAQVSAFCQAVLKTIVPRGFWGGDSVAEHNESIFLKKLDQFVSLRRFEGMSLHEVTQSLKLTDIDWLAPSKLMSNKTSKTDVMKRAELFNEFLYFLFDSIVIPLIRSNFYVTESNSDKYRLFFFRHDIWRSLAEPAMATLKGKMFKEVNLEDARRILGSRPLGFSQVRLLPKGVGMRPIMNLRKRVASRRNPKELGPGINKILAPAHTVLQFEKNLNPEKLGSTMFSVGDIYRRIRPFKTTMAQHSGKLYFAKLDVQSAFDTIPQAAIVSLLDSIPQQRQYRLSKYLEVAPNLANSTNDNSPRTKPLKKWPSVATSNRDASNFLQLLESGRAATKRNTVFVDLWKKQHETSELLQLVSSHIQQNLVKVGKKFYRQKEGIPQGSVLSSTLCNYFYADLEFHVLPFLKSEDCLLLRLIDDFLLITTDKTKAVRFVETMHRGVPEYGVTVNPRKTLVNFDMTFGDQGVAKLQSGKGFPYCGTVIDCKTLDISRPQDKEEATAIYNSLTVEFTRTPGQTFQRKVLNAFKIQSHLMFFDTALNSAGTMLRNSYNAFTQTATKMWAYARCLPAPKKPSAALVNRTIAKLVEMAYLLLISKTRRLRYPGYVCDVKKCEVSWLAYNAFQKVLVRKQSRYHETLGWLEAEMRKLRLLKDIRHGRVREVA